MGTFKFEPAGRMVELRRLPFRRRMAARTVGGVVRDELSPVNVGMAGLAIGPDTGKANGLELTGRSHVDVTLVTGDFGMAPLKWEIALGVVVFDHVPSLYRVAQFASA
jgi:hypothetical protein